MSKSAFISSTAKISELGVSIGKGSHVGGRASIGPGVTIGRDTQISGNVLIMEGANIGNDVRIGPRTRIEPRALILDRAIICPNNVRSRSSDARKLGHSVSIGADVQLHDEVELGDYAVIPSQQTIAAIGSFGTKNRVVTIYGSDEGPRYSIGCQIGVNFTRIKNHVVASTYTTPESAQTYAPFLDIFQQIGATVQRAYAVESNLVDEMQYMRLGLQLDS